MKWGSALRALAIAAACIAATAALPAAAGAATNLYAPNAQSRTFDGGIGDWIADVTYSGVCVPGLTCLSVTNEHQADGGPDGAGDGFIRSEATSLASLLSTTDVIWDSPVFRYRGAGGRVPQSLTLGLDRRTDLSSLLPVIGEEALYSVEAVPAGGGAPVALIDPTSLEGAEDEWISDPTTSVAPGALEVGELYLLRITSEFSADLALLASGTVDYDNVVLRAHRAVTAGELAKGVKAKIGAAKLKGKRLRVRVGCPGSVRPAKCSLKVVALLKRKGKKATKAKRLGVKAGGRKVAKLRVKPKRLAKLANRRKVWIRVNARGGGAKTVVRKKVRLRIS